MVLTMYFEKRASRKLKALSSNPAFPDKIFRTTTISNTKPFVKTVNSWKPLTNATKISIPDAVAARDPPLLSTHS